MLCHNFLTSRQITGALPKVFYEKKLQRNIEDGKCHEYVVTSIKGNIINFFIQNNRIYFHDLHNIYFCDFDTHHVTCIHEETDHLFDKVTGYIFEVFQERLYFTNYANLDDGVDLKKIFGFRSIDLKNPNEKLRGVGKYGSYACIPFMRLEEMMVSFDSNYARIDFFSIHGVFLKSSKFNKPSSEFLAKTGYGRMLQTEAYCIYISDVGICIFEQKFEIMQFVKWDEPNLTIHSAFARGDLLALSVSRPDDSYAMLIVSLSSLVKKSYAMHSDFDQAFFFQHYIITQCTNHGFFAKTSFIDKLPIEITDLHKKETTTLLDEEKDIYAKIEVGRVNDVHRLECFDEKEQLLVVSVRDDIYDYTCHYSYKFFNLNTRIFTGQQMIQGWEVTQPPIRAIFEEGHLMIPYKHSLFIYNYNVLDEDLELSKEIRESFIADAQASGIPSFLAAFHIGEQVNNESCAQQ